MRARYVRVGTGVARVLTCVECGAEWDQLGSGRPRRYCGSCSVLVKRRRARDRYHETKKPPLVLRRIVLGPAPCQGCREAVTWNGYAWESVSGDRHSCDNALVGISDASPDIMCDALLVADTSREGVPRLEVSAP